MERPVALAACFWHQLARCARARSSLTMRPFLLCDRVRSHRDVSLASGSSPVRVVHDLTQTPSPPALVRQTPRLSYPATLRAPTGSSHAHQPSHTHAAKDASASSHENSHPHSHASPKHPTNASSSGHSPPAPTTHGHQRRLKNPDWVIPEIEFDDKVMCHMPFHTPEGVWDNPWPTWKSKTVLDIAKFVARGFKNRLPSQDAINRYYPMVTPNIAAIHAPNPAHIQATWVGHSTFLVQVDGLNFLTDPVWNEFASPIPFGPKRYRPPGIPIEKLPRIDFILLSHNHYDHLDLQVVKKIGNSAKWYVPLGMKEWFYRENVTNVFELGWWESVIHGDRAAAVFLLPSQHWSKRTMWDERRALWGSFSVHTPKHSVYFAGDTGYCSVFPEIGKRLGPFDLSLLPIGAYHPRDFMGPAHADPAGAVDIHLDIRSRKSIAMHFGTFRLTDEPAYEPPRVLLEELAERKVSPEDFFVLNHGETVQMLKDGDKVIVV